MKDDGFHSPQRCSTWSQLSRYLIALDIVFRTFQVAEVEVRVDYVSLGVAREIPVLEVGSRPISRSSIFHIQWTNVNVKV
jgi:hypothetical protein